MKQLLLRLHRIPLWAGMALALMAAPALAQETVCASVKIQILQELTMERQAFSAEMKINNTTDNGIIENVSVVVKIMELDGTPVAVTEDPNAVGAKFFVRVSSMDKIANVTGTGAVAPASTAIINWLIIPAPGSAGISSTGKKYLIGATLRYRFGGDEQTLDVAPDVVTVKPLPLLTLDYFLPQEVEADDPLTLAVEPPVPFNLGLRIRNNGYATAKTVKIDSAQPKIVENNQGLLVNFRITGSSIDDLAAQNTLLLNFGDIAPASSKSGRWVMESTLSGRFTEFAASFSHADELGGAVTSILQATNAHLLIRDVRVDLPGRDVVRDFLAKDGDVIRVYESEGLDTIVTDRSAVAQLQSSAGTPGVAGYKLTIPPTDGFIYVKLPDPFGGTKALGAVMRSDAKLMPAENVWLSRSRNTQSKEWEYFINFFDVNTPGVYESSFQAPPQVALPPVIQFISDKVVKVGQQVSFIVEASSPQGSVVSLSAAPLPSGATFTPQASTGSVTVTRAAFSWVPGTGTVGNYLINYTASDGVLSSSRSASVRVEAAAPATVPMTPAIQSPLAGAQVETHRPELVVMTGAESQDASTQVQFELFSDEAGTQTVASATVARSVSGSGTATVVLPTVWALPQDLADNTRYWWRARGSDGTRFSAWANAGFFVNLANEAPGSFNLTSPAQNAEVATLMPQLSWTSSIDPDGDTPSYVVQVYRNSALTDLVATSPQLQQNVDGITSWTVTSALENHVRYYWRVTARDPQGAQTPVPAHQFVVNTGNVAPSTPTVLSPPLGGESSVSNTILTIQNSIDADGDLITYVFELDTVNTFDSSSKRSSGQIIQGGGSTTGWPVADLVENQTYHWRVKAQDGRAESAWVAGSFMMNAVNEAPPAPTVSNPGNGSWVSTQQPTLQVNPVQDPERKTVRYQFEVYAGAGLMNMVAEGISDAPGWIPPSALTDKTTHYWRARALDDLNLPSEWSAVSSFYVLVGPYQAPTIRVTAPSTTQAPDTVVVNGLEKKQVILRWEGTASGPDPKVALYYSTSNSGYAGTLIIDGLPLNTSSPGTYNWDVTTLGSGAYYIYGVAYDSNGQGQAYAPGAVVVPVASSPGYLVQEDPGVVKFTTEAGGTATIRMMLGNAPTHAVTVPLSSSQPGEGTVQPTALTFTPANWNMWQAATVTGVNDCASDNRNRYQIIVGTAQSLDPNYMGITGVPYQMSSRDNKEARSTTDNPNIFLCGLTIVSERQIEKQVWEYQVRADLSNSGPAVGGVTAKLIDASNKLTIVQPVLRFGAVSRAEVGRTSDTVTLRSKSRISASLLDRAKGFRWAITVTP